MRTQNLLTTSVALGLLAFAPACFVVDDAALKEARNNAADGGADGGSTVAAADQCGDPATPALKNSEAMQSARVDTTSLSMFPTNLQPSCAGVGGTPGNDGFLRLDVQAGQYFHFHVQPITAGRDPVVYMLQSNCDVTSCAGLTLANRCGVGQDEHFGFRFTNGGTWYLGVDDKATGGGEYIVGAFRPTCGNGVKEHGEGCDNADPNPPMGQVCDDQCRVVISGTTVSEVEINDDIYWANHVSFGAEPLPTTVPPVTVNGTLLGTCDPDAYTIRLASARIFTVTQLPPSGVTCPASNANVTLRVTLASGVDAQGMVTTAANGCLQYTSTTALPTGQYFVQMTYDGTPMDTTVPYKLQMAIQ